MIEVPISISELREKYQTRPVREVIEYFNLPNATRLYQLLSQAGIPRKRNPRPTMKIKLVD